MQHLQHPDTQATLQSILARMTRIESDITEIMAEQKNTRDLFNRGRGALWVLSIIGGLVLSMMVFWHDLAQWFWRLH